MTNEQIRRELRRSACEDASQYWVADHAYVIAHSFREGQESFTSGDKHEKWRMFYLLVAEALT